MAMLVYRREYFFPNHHFGHLSSKFRGYRGSLFFLEVFDSSVGSFVGFDGSFGGYEVLDFLVHMSPEKISKTYMLRFCCCLGLFGS